MSINFANVKAITIPEGSVKSIASGGVTLWSATPQVVTPYRKLEYIHLNGAEWIDTGLKVNYPKNRAIWCKVDSAATTTSMRVIGAYNSASDDAGRRYYFLANRDNGFGFSIGNQWLGGKATANLHDPVLIYGTINNTGKATSWGIKSPDDVTTYESGSGFSTTIAIGQTANIFIGANSNDANQPDTNTFFKGNIYKYVIKNTNGSGPIENEMWPAQRKSDGVCGMYDRYTSTFHPMQGTTITSSAAGPTVVENWDPTLSPVTPGNPVTIPAANWSRNGNYYYTQSNNFWNYLENNHGEMNTITVKLTVQVYNATEDATYTSTKTNTLSRDSAPQWYRSNFNIPLTYNSNGDTINVGQLRVKSYSSYISATNMNSVSSIYNNNCTLKDVTLEIVS